MGLDGSLAGYGWSKMGRTTFVQTRKMKHPLPFSAAFVLCLALPNIATGQCTDLVSHTTGAQVVAGINVTVGSTGTVDVNSTYCSETVPYFIGYNYVTGSGTGSYTFSFAPPISAATFNVSGISDVPLSDLEHVRLFINGAHYAVPAPGIALTCDAYAVLTPDGDIAPCPGCNVSGMGQITLPGPISSLTVVDTVFMGSPNGAIFSLFICDEANGIDASGNAADLLPFPNPASTIIALPDFDSPVTTAEIHDMQGRMVRSFQRVHGDRSPLNVADLPRGAYVLVLRNASTTHYRIVLE